MPQLSVDSHPMQWTNIISDPSLQDLPFKVETNEYGQIVMTPASNRHSRLQSHVQRRLLSAMSGGDAFVECSIQTSQGVKVADVVWASDEVLARYTDIDPMPRAPEICVEVKSPSNSLRDLENKRQLYFERGAIEYWICDASGVMSFYSVNGQMTASQLAPAFPAHVTF